MQTRVDQRIGVSAVTGFLGSGKTTLLNRILRMPAAERTLVIVNEFGDIAVDHNLVRHTPGQVFAVEGGCLCCVVQGDLSTTLREVFQQASQRTIPTFERVWIETSGLSDGASIMFTLKHDAFLSQRYVWKTCLTLADASLVREQVERFSEAARQLGMADAILLTKTDMAARETIEQAQEQLYVMNPTAQYLSSDEEAAAFLLAPPSERSHLPRLLFAERVGWASDTRGRETLRPRHTPVVAMVYRFSGQWARSAFVHAMDAVLATHGASVLRMKGILQFANDDRTYVVHAVHGTLYPTSVLPDSSSPVANSQLVWILHSQRSRKSAADLCQQLGDTGMPGKGAIQGADIPTSDIDRNQLCPDRHEA